MTVSLFGATGLVGGHCLQLLLADDRYARITVAGRRPLPGGPPAGPPRLEERVIDFDRLPDHPEAVASHAVICALGTTIKKAGSQERFREVDHDYPLAIARLALAAGARHFLLVSAIGADAGSRVFYNRVKGELEDALLALDYPRITILRPSLLLGDRDEFRLGEAIAGQLAFLIPGRYRPVHARSVARALAGEALRSEAGRLVLESDEIRRRYG